MIVIDVLALYAFSNVLVVKVTGLFSCLQDEDFIYFSRYMQCIAAISSSIK